MVGRFALFAALVLGFAFLAVPREGAWEDRGEDSGGSWRPKAGAQPLTTAPSESDSAWYGGDHTLARRGDGHFYASTTINGASAYMLVDTGASVIALTGSDAQAAGIQWDESAVRPIGRGASGTVYGVPTRLREVAIGNLTQRNVEAVIIPRGLDVSLLGQSYLSRLDGVEISGDTMTLNGG